MRSALLMAAFAAALISASAIQAAGTDQPAAGATGQATGAAGQTAGTTDTTVQASDLDTIVCKDIGPPTGSHLGGKRVCDSKRHWLQLQQDSQDTLQKIQSTSCVGGQGCGG